MGNQNESENQKVKSDGVKFKIPVKQRAFQLAVSLIKTIDSLSGDMSSVIIAKQLIRSSTSIGANIIEAQGASSKKDFANFFHHALKSANETKFWLCLLRDTGKIKYETVKPILNETYEIANILGASLLTLKGKR